MTKVINTINDDILSENICFIPTMGAIHEGHLSLVDIGKETNLKTLVSVFLNRRQFNNDDDFKNYPIELEQDIQFLKSRGCLLYTSPSPRDATLSRMPSSA